MKNIRPIHMLLIASGFITLMTLGFILILKYVLSISIDTKAIVILPVLVFGSCYFIFYFTLKKFIYQKIRLIYKSITRLKSPINYEEKIGLQNDVIGDVEKEVNQWAVNKRNEIQRLKKMETYRREFLGNVSHELKTPIYNIQGYLETLIDGGIFDDNINVKYLKKAFENTNRLGVIVSDLEMISRLESEDLTLEMKSFDIISFIKEILTSLELQASNYNIKLGFKDIQNSSLYVNADKNRIEQVVVNLITNSIKYGNEGGETLISCYDMDENVLVEINDNGIGIEKDHIPRLFERFYRIDTNRSREQGGTGLGLAIVKHIIEAHNQTINVRSTVGIGSTFGFTLKKG